MIKVSKAPTRFEQVSKLPPESPLTLLRHGSPSSGSNHRSSHSNHSQETGYDRDGDSDSGGGNTQGEGVTQSQRQKHKRRPTETREQGRRDREKDEEGPDKETYWCARVSRFRCKAAPGVRRCSCRLPRQSVERILGEEAHAYQVPLCAVIMELAQVEQLGARVDLQWTPREGNKEADALSYLEFTGFSAQRSGVRHGEH